MSQAATPGGPGRPVDRTAPAIPDAITVASPGGSSAVLTTAGAAGAPGSPLSARSPLLPIAAAGALGLAASLAAARLLPSSPGDPLAGTLDLLPLLLAALHGIHRWAVYQGGRRLARAGTAGELALLGALLAAAIARPTLHLDWADEVLAAGLLLVLGHRVGRQLLALRPLLGDRLGARPPALFFWLPLTAYVAILPWSAGHHQPDGDEPYNLLITHSLAYDGDADLANNYAAGDWRRFMNRPIAPQPGDPIGPHGERYSRHNALLPLALAPAYRLAGKTGAQVTMALMTAALAWLTLRLGRHYARRRPGEVLVAYGWLAFAPPLPLYSYQLWVEVPAALLTVLALDAILSLRAQPSPAPPDVSTTLAAASAADAPGVLDAPDATAALAACRIPGAPISGSPGAAARGLPPAARRAQLALWLAAGVPLLLLPLLKIRFILIAAPLLVLAGWQAARQRHLRRRVAVLALLLLALVGGILLYNQRLFSNPLKIHELGEIDPHRHAALDYLDGSLGLFYDAAFGLFGFAPLWLLAVPALALLAWRRQALPVHLAVLTLPYLLIVVPRDEWYGGWSPPFRYALIMLPLLALAVAPLLAERRRAGPRALIGGLGALTLVVALVWLVVPGWTYNFADGRTYVLDHLSGRLGADVARLFPSAVRPRAALWVWPPLSAAAVLAAWWLRRRRRPRACGAAPLAAPRVSSGAAALAGIAAVLAAAAALPLAAHRLPTRVIELEDPQVQKLGGEAYPARWVIERTRYRGGWVLRAGEQLRAPVVPGGRRVRLRLAGELIRNQPVPFAVEVAAGDRLLAVWRPVHDRTWEDLAAGPFDWPAGAPLVLIARGPAPPGAVNGAVLDRIDLQWQ